jgi:type III restriction enzyme
MSEQFFQKPILNSPYDYPGRHWELDPTGQPTQKVIESRRWAEFITPIPKPKKQRGKGKQGAILFDEATTLTDAQTRHGHSALINELRHEVDQWRRLTNPADWRVTPESARLLQHWRNHPFSGVRPFFCQVESVETAIWLAEVAPVIGKRGQRYLDHLESARAEANPDLIRLALKLATGAGKTTVMAMLIAWQTINAVRRTKGIVEAERGKSRPAKAMLDPYNPVGTTRHVNFTTSKPTATTPAARPPNATSIG